MAGRLILPFWPTTLDCISWSKDNLIAVAAGEHVAILLPRFKDTSSNGLYWDQVIVKVNAFSASEYPLLDPLRSSNLSLGEELSTRHVLSLQWSSPGLGKYGRCVLAVLTTDHLLSIWECEDALASARDWKRKIVVNVDIRRFYEQLPPADLSGVEYEHTRAEQIQVCQRVKAFAWSSKMEVNGQHGSRPHGRWHRLAVTTEGGHIQLLSVRSPYDVLHPELNTWTVEVTRSFHLDDHTGVNGTKDPLGTEVKAPAVHGKSITADYLALSPSGQAEHGCQDSMVTMAYIAKGMLFTASLSANTLDDLPNVRHDYQLNEKRHLASRRDLVGPLVFDLEGRSVYACAPDTIYKVSLSDGEETHIVSRDLDGRWDEVSGIALTGKGQDVTSLHITSHLTTASARTLSLSASLEGGESLAPPWHREICEGKATFSTEWDLGGNVQERTWGIASSPMGDYVTTCNTYHPSDTVAYVVRSEEQCVVTISHSAAVLRTTGALVSTDMSADTLYFSMRRYLETGIESIENKRLAASRLWERFAKMDNGVEGGEDDTASSIIDEIFDEHKSLTRSGKSIEVVARHLSQRLYDRPNVQRARFETLVALATDQAQGSESPCRSILHCVISEILRLPDWVYEISEASSKILRTYESVRRRLDPETGHGASVYEDGDEDCSVCGSKIPFQSMKWAKCTHGHHFSRCALTGLAIQEPGISKQCGICGTLYLDETRVPLLSQAGSEDSNGSTGIFSLETSEQTSTMAEPPRSLMRILFTACATCIYCGGRFRT